MSIDEIAASIAEDFAFLENWEERYGHIIALGRERGNKSNNVEELQIPANRVGNCVSNVWLACAVGADGRLYFRGVSDALIVSGLLALLLDLCSERRPEEILAFDAEAFFAHIGIDAALSPQRANGLRSIYGRIRAFAMNAQQKRS